MREAIQYRWARRWQAACADPPASSFELSRVLFIGADRRADSLALLLAEEVDVDWVFDVYGARDRSRNARFDLMIMDAPGGRAGAAGRLDKRAIAELCELVPGLPLLVLVESRPQGVDALRHGAHGFLVKQRIAHDALVDAACMAMELHRSRMALDEMDRQLLHADRLASLGQLAAGVVHEINNPTAQLVANLSAMRAQLAGVRPGMDENLREWVDILDESIAGLGQLRSIVDDLRVFSRVDSDEVEAVDLASVIDTACKLSDGVIRPRARLLKELAPVPAVQGAHGKLVQVFTNLLTNAAHAIEGARSDNHIRVTAGERDGYVIAAVEDTGRGIAEPVRKLVFEPFFTTKPRDLGTGLGLSLSAEIVHRYGGDIGFASTASGGTRFEVRLLPSTEPVESARGQTTRGQTTRGQTTPGQTSVASAPARRARVLVVDDEPGLLRAYRRVLAPQHDVVMAASGRQALDILAADPRFDSVICDLLMPDVDGIRIYETVAAHDSALAARIVFCTGGPVSRRGRRFVDSIDNTVLEKPVMPELLLGAIAQLGMRLMDDD